MSSPRIGKAYEKASNALAAQARILKKQADAIAEIEEAVDRTDEVVDHLARLANEQHANEHNEKEAKAAEVRAQYADLISRAEKILNENVTATTELSPFIRRLAAIDWKAVRARAKNSIEVGSMHSTETRLAMLQRLVEEATDLLRGEEKDLLMYLNQVRGFTGFEQEHEREFASNGLHANMNPRGEMLRSKVGAIKKFLAEVASDLSTLDAAAVREDA